MLVAGAAALVWMLRNTGANGTAVVTALVGAALVASGCLSATPPKTPDQREAERRAPRVVVPPPVGERTPHPAPPG